jgi:hypothetical protein
LDQILQTVLECSGRRRHRRYDRRNLALANTKADSVPQHDRNAKARPPADARAEPEKPTGLGRETGTVQRVERLELAKSSTPNQRSACWCSEQFDQRPRQRLTAWANITDELEELQIQGRFEPRDPPCGRSQKPINGQRTSVVLTWTLQKPSPFTFARKLACRMTHRAMVVAPFAHPPVTRDW